MKQLALTGRLTAPSPTLSISLIALLVALGAATYGAAPAGARSDTWRKNTFHVTRFGVFHADFLWITAATVFLPLGMRASRIALRHR